MPLTQGYGNGEGGVNWGNVFGTAAAGGAGALPQTSSGTTTNSSTTNSNSTSNNSGSQSSSGITTPILDGETLDFRNQLMNRYMQSLAPSDWSGFRLGGIQNINNNANIADQATQNILQSRGLNFSPVAGTQLSQNQNNRLNQIGQFENDLPLKAMAFDQQRLNDAGGFFSRIPTGTANISEANLEAHSNAESQSKTEGTSTTKNSSGGGWKGALGGIASAAAHIFLGV